MGSGDLEQFDLLEQRIESLIKFVDSLREEKQNLEKLIYEKEQMASSLSKETEELKADRDSFRKRIASLLEKIENVGL